MAKKFDRIYGQELTLLQTVTFGKRTILFETFVGFDRFHKEFFNLKMKKTMSFQDSNSRLDLRWI